MIPNWSLVIWVPATPATYSGRKETRESEAAKGLRCCREYSRWRALSMEAGCISTAAGPRHSLNRFSRID